MAEDWSQQRRALQKANYVRSQRAEMKALLKARALDPWRLLRGLEDDWEPIVREMRIDRFLDAVPGIGEVTRNETLLEMKLMPHWLVGALTFERRAEMARLLALALAEEPVPPSPTPVEEETHAA